MPADPSQNPPRTNCWTLAVLGFASSAIGSLVGVGGGIIIVPILTFLGVSQKKAQGTSLLVIVSRHPLVIAMYWYFGNIDFGFAIPLAIGGIAGALLGVKAAGKFPNRTLAIYFGILLIAVALFMVFVQMPSGMKLIEISTPAGFILVAIFGCLAGFMAGFFGIGGGLVFVPTGVIGGGLEQVVSQGTGYVSGFPTILTGFLGYRKQGEWDWDLAKWLIPGAWIGTVIGAWGADVVPGRTLTIIFSVFLVVAGLRMLMKRGDIGNQQQ